MRISTHQLFDRGAARITDAQTALAHTQQQVASGRRMLSPSDDPVAAARALEVAQTQALNQQYAANRVQVRNAVSGVEGTLGSVTEAIQSVRELLVSVGNPNFTDTQRGLVATELGSRFAELLGLANSRDAQGNHVFAGFQTSTVPFVETPAGASYHGDAGRQFVQVDSNRQLAMSDPGVSVFQGGGQDIFQTIKDAIALLQTPVVTPANQAALQSGLTTGISGIDRALENVLTVRASMGNRLQELDALDAAGDSRNVQYSAILSGIQDLDYTEALTRQARQQLTLEAAQQSFVKMNSLSLFNFLR